MSKTSQDEIDEAFKRLEVRALRDAPITQMHIGIAKKELTAKINKLLIEARIKELEYIKSQNVAIPCEPDCDEIRHARHEGAWEQHLEYDDDIDKRIETITAQFNSKGDK